MVLDVIDETYVSMAHGLIMISEAKSRAVLIRIIICTVIRSVC